MIDKGTSKFIRWLEVTWWWITVNTLCRFGFHNRQSVFMDDLEPRLIICMRCGK
jgi:hypothetical protein